jgi:tRNA(His) 5'-end guanylyltransferase
LGRFTARYNFEKPNDKRGIDLMNAAAKGVMTEVLDIVLGYGISDEYRFSPSRFHPITSFLTPLVSYFIKQARFSTAAQGMTL